MTKFDTAKKTIIVTAKAIKQFASILFDHLKDAINFVITKIDTKKALTDVSKAIIVSILSYSLVIAAGYHFIKKIDALNFLSDGYHNFSSLLTQFSHKSEPYIYDDKKAAELEKEANELKKQNNSNSTQAASTSEKIVVNCTIYSKVWGSVGAWQIKLDADSSSAYVITIGQPNSWTALTSSLLDRNIPLKDRVSAEGARFYMMGDSDHMFALNRDTMQFRYGASDTGSSEWGNCRIAPKGL